MMNLVWMRTGFKRDDLLRELLSPKGSGDDTSSSNLEYTLLLSRPYEPTQPHAKSSHPDSAMGAWAVELARVLEADFLASARL